MSRYLILVSCTALLVCLPGPHVLGSNKTTNTSGRLWTQITAEAERLGLPTNFLRTVPADFVAFEFDDLQAFAAEYHPSEHRMVLNRRLSFNVAGRTLRPLARLTHGELETLYHELFHAYMDYLTTRDAQGHRDPFISFAREQQQCRYGAVHITPVVQRKQQTEERFLSERESWEALNEAWAVFIGWTIWNQLEIGGGTGRSIQKSSKQQDAWLQRLEAADREGKLRGYYEPEDPDERRVTRKRYLAPSSRLSSEEIERLMTGPLELSEEVVNEAVKRLAGTQDTLLHPKTCDRNSRTN